MAEDYDLSVFDTITSLMGRDITRCIQQRSRSVPDGKRQLVNNNSHGDAESRQPLLAGPDLLQTQEEVSCLFRSRPPVDVEQGRLLKTWNVVDEVSC